MKISVLGTGIVGQTIAAKLSQLGHQVFMGTRNPLQTIQNKEPNRMTGVIFNDWYQINSEIELLPFGEVAKNTDLVVNASSGKTTISTLEMVGEENLAGKILIDIANPLDFSNGFPSINPVNNDSLGEQIQRRFPNIKVVKSLSTMNAHVMVNPDSVNGDHNVFISGNDKEAKVVVGNLLKSIGWKHNSIIDLGDITSARGVEMLLPLWIRLYTKLGHPNFNFHIQKGE